MAGPARVLLVVAAHLAAFAALVAGLVIDDPWYFLAYVAAVIAVIYGGRRLLQRFGVPSFSIMFQAERRVAKASVIFCLALFPLVFVIGFQRPYWILVATTAGIYVCLALGLNIVVGLAGLLDLGYIAFYAIGAYVSALASLRFHDWWVLWLMVPVSMMAAGLFGVTLGAPTLRLRGDYLAIVTLGFGEIIRIVLINWKNATNGPIGLPGIPYPRIFGFDFGKGVNIAGIQFPREFMFYVLVVLLAFVIAGVAHRLDDSRIGRAWRAIREDELAAGAMGINTRNLKLLAFASGASFAGVSGLVFAHMNTFIEPNSFVFMESAFILCMVVLGGMGSIPGVVVGAILLTVLPEKFRSFQDYRMLVLGVSLVVMMVLRPQGLIPRSSSRPGSTSLARDSS